MDLDRREFDDKITDMFIEIAQKKLEWRRPIIQTNKIRHSKKDLQTR